MQTDFTYDFKITTHGKWILTGEHAVLRGCPALLFPVASRSMSLAYQANSQEPQIEFLGHADETLQAIFWLAFERAIDIVKRSRHVITGKFLLSNTIPISAGMGASAALCVSIGRWLIWQGWLTENSLYEFARELENLFHQESSGADIAAILSQTGTYFVRNGERRPLTINWQPVWYLSHSGQSSSTATCINKVKALWQQDMQLGQQIDADMYESVRLAEVALKLPAKEGLPLLRQALDLGCSCFERWNLTGGKIGEHMAQLREAGALAVKPTGSGDGGFVLSLWEQPPKVTAFELISL